MIYQIRRPWTSLLVFLFLLCWSPSPASAQNGIFADFTTSMGNFTCQLDYTNAPKAVANFIGLATGEKAWLDSVQGRVRNDPYFNGLTFHRVIAGFMIQGGSRDATGGDGPGYAFVDQFTPSMVFNSFGMLAMANSGTNSNGAQFFVTVAPTTWLNNLHTIFGRLTSGSNVVYAISRVSTDSSDKPLTNVVVQQVSIRRVGTAAQAFDIAAQSLPVVTNLTAKIRSAQDLAGISFTNRPFADSRLYASINMSQWSETELGIEIGTPATNVVYATMSKAKEYFRMAQVQYPSSTHAPKTVTNRVLTLNFGGGLGTIVITFNNSGGGTYTYTGGNPGTVTEYYWSQEPYRGRLWPVYYSGLATMTLWLNFSAANSGAFSGTAYTSTPFSVSGTFVLGP